MRKLDVQPCEIGIRQGPLHPSGEVEPGEVLAFKQKRRAGWCVGGCLCQGWAVGAERSSQ